MAQLTDFVGPDAQHAFEQRILQRVEELNIPGDFASLSAKPLLSFTLAELLIVASGLDTTVNWLLTGHHHFTSTTCECDLTCEHGSAPDNASTSTTEEFTR